MGRVRIKMCGMTRAEDIAHAIELGVDAIGLIFYSKSKRYISPERAKILLKNIPAFVDVVAVVVEPEPGFVAQLLTELPIQFLQFHGDESPEFCMQFNTPYIKAVSASRRTTIEKAVELHSKATAILADTPTPDHGGSGEVFDWQMLPSMSKPLILAGGLDAQNVKSALHHKPFAVDVCSGLELSPGIKDHNRMTEFVAAIWGKE